MRFYILPFPQCENFDYNVCPSWKLGVISKEAGTSFVCKGIEKVTILPFWVQLRLDL